MSLHEQAHEVNIDCRYSSYMTKVQLQGAHSLRKGGGLFKIGKTFYLEVLEKASATEAETAGETNFHSRSNYAKARSQLMRRLETAKWAQTMEQSAVEAFKFGALKPESNFL